MIWGKTHYFRKHPFSFYYSSRHQNYLLTRRKLFGFGSGVKLSCQAVLGLIYMYHFGKVCLLLFSPTIFLSKSKVLSSMHKYWITSESSLNPWKEDQLERCTYFPIYKWRKRECYFTAPNWTPYQIPGKQIHPTKISGVFSWWLFYCTFDPKNLSSFPGEEIFMGRFLSGDQNNH